nr:MAG TPA: hypothetical protein [Caudoviricetes sp.]
MLHSSVYAGLLALNIYHLLYKYSRNDMFLFSMQHKMQHEF